MDRVKIIQNLMAIASDVEPLQPKEVEDRIRVLRVLADEWKGLEMPIPIDEQFELIYLLTGRQIIESLK